MYIYNKNIFSNLYIKIINKIKENKIKLNVVPHPNFF